MPKLPKVSYYVEFLSRTQVIAILNMNLDIKHMLNCPHTFCEDTGGGANDICKSCDGAIVFNAAFNHQRHVTETAEQPEINTELVALPESSRAPVCCPALRQV